LKGNLANPKSAKDVPADKERNIAKSELAVDWGLFWKVIWPIQSQ
jgi:hypothetical protein